MTMLHYLQERYIVAVFVASLVFLHLSNACMFWFLPQHHFVAVFFVAPKFAIFETLSLLMLTSNLNTHTPTQEHTPGACLGGVVVLLPPLCALFPGLVCHAPPGPCMCTCLGFPPAVHPARPVVLEGAVCALLGRGLAIPPTSLGWACCCCCCRSMLKACLGGRAVISPRSPALLEVCLGGCALMSPRCCLYCLLRPAPPCVSKRVAHPALLEALFLLPVTHMQTAACHGGLISSCACGSRT